MLNQHGVLVYPNDIVYSFETRSHMFLHVEDLCPSQQDVCAQEDLCVLDNHDVDILDSLNHYEVYALDVETKLRNQLHTVKSPYKKR